MKQNSVKTPAKGQAKITAFFQNRPTPNSSKRQEDNQNEDPDIENREIDEPGRVKEPTKKNPVQLKEGQKEVSVPTVFIDDDDEDQDKNDNDKNKAVRDDDYDSDEVQKPRDKSKRATEDPWSDDSPKIRRKSVQKRRKPAPEGDEIVEDGIIGMKVRSPNNSGLD